MDTAFPLYNLNPASSVSEVMRTLEKDALRKEQMSNTWEWVGVEGVAGEVDDIPMAKVYHQIINLTNKPPSLRTDDELEQLVPWLRKKSSSLFHDLEDVKIKKLLKEADFRRYRFDDVIIRQGDEGDEFYILISGSISFHVGGGEDVDAMVLKQHAEEEAAHDQARPVNREVYGTQVGIGLEGKTFGELALIHPDCVRNATVISTNIYSDVLVVSKDLYSETILGSQVREFEAKTKFINECPLFHKCNAKLRKMMAMSVEKINLKFEDVIVKQGSPVNGLHFLVSGQVKIRVDPTMHPLQYPQHFPVGDIADMERQKARDILRKEMHLTGPGKAIKKEPPGERKYAQEGGRKASRALELCLMGAVDTIGDLEMVLSLSSYSQTVICTEAACIYHLDQRNYDRLVEKRNPQTVDLMRDIVHTKLTLHFQRLADDAIPMYRYILYTLDEREREARDKRQQQRHREQTGRGRNSTAPAPAPTETTWEIDNLQKGPLVNLYGPGSVFHWIRTKAKERKQKQKRANAQGGNQNNPAFRFGQNPMQTAPGFGRTPLADNTRFLYADDTSEVSDTHIVNLYGYNENTAPRFIHDEYDGEMPVFDDFYEEDEDWATSDMALSNLEERLMRWHSSFSHTDKAPKAAAATAAAQAKKISTAALTAPSPGAPRSASTTAVVPVVKLHRFHCADENRPKPGNKVYVRGRGEKSKEFSSVPPTDSPTSSPEYEKSLSKFLLNQTKSPQPPSPSERQFDIGANATTVILDDGENSPKVLLPKRANSAGVPRASRFASAFKKSKNRHQFTGEEYQQLKTELRRRQKAYKSFLPQRSNTVLF